MQFCLRDNLYFCIHSGRTVFLDVEADRYFGLPTWVDHAFQRIAASGFVIEQDEQASRFLMSQGIIVQQPANFDNATLPVLGTPLMSPLKDLPLDHARPDAITVMAVACEQLKARSELRKRPLVQILSGLAAPIASPAQAHQDYRLQRIAAAFVSIGKFLKREDECLPISLAFKRICARAGISTKLTFGVSLDPFSAHCWVQEGDRVISDTLERVRLFTPILAV